MSFAVLGVLFLFLPSGDILSALSRVPLPLFASVAVLILISHLFAATKWWLQIGQVVPITTAIRAHYIGLTANLCLPGVAGGDAARIAVAWPRAGDRSRLAAGSVSDRLIDLVALCCVALLGLLLAENADTQLALTVLPPVLALFVLGLWVGPRLVAALWRAVPRLPARAFVLKTCEAAAEIGRRPLFLAAMLVFSVAIQSGLIVIAFQLAKAAIPKALLAEILHRIEGLRPAPLTT